MLWSLLPKSSPPTGSKNGESIERVNKSNREGQFTAGEGSAQVFCHEVSKSDVMEEDRNSDQR